MWDKKTPYDEYIEHYGVLGMKWGRRNSRSSSSSKERKSFTEGGTRKADAVIGEKDKKRAMAKIKTNSTTREKEWQKLYLKRSTMGDREIQLALTRLKLENQLAKEVNTAKELTKVQPKPSFLEKHGGKIVIASKVTEVISGNMIGGKDKEKPNANAQVVNTIAKNVGKIASEVSKKKDK